MTPIELFGWILVTIGAGCAYKIVQDEKPVPVAVKDGEDGRYRLS